MIGECGRIGKRPEPPLPPVEVGHRGGEAVRVEIRPHHRQETELGVGALPEQKIAQSALAPSPDQQIHRRRLGAAVVHDGEEAGERLV